MIKIDINKVCCFPLLCKSVFSVRFISSSLVASPIERRSRLAIENIEKAIYEVIVPLPPPTPPSSAFHSNWPNISLSQISVHFYAMDFYPPRHSYVYFIPHINCYVLTLVPVWFCGLRNISTAISLSAAKYRLRTTELKKTNLLLSL